MINKIINFFRSEKKCNCTCVPILNHESGGLYIWSSLWMHQPDFLYKPPIRMVCADQQCLKCLEVTKTVWFVCDKKDLDSLPPLVEIVPALGDKDWQKNMRYSTPEHPFKRMYEIPDLNEIKLEE
jgi:hypothetical protein